MSASKAPLTGRFSLGALCAGLGALFFLLGWLAPNHYLPWLSFHNEAPIFASLIALAAALCCRPSLVVLPRGAAMLPGLVMLLIAVQAAIGVVLYRGHAVLGLLYVSGMLAAWWLGASGMQGVQDRKAALTWGAALLATAAVLSGYLEVLQWLQLETALKMYAVEREPGSRPSANLAQPNLLATLLIMGTVAAAMLWHLRRIKGWQAVVLLVFLSFTTVMTESRAGLLSAFGVGTVALLQSRRANVPHARHMVLLWWAVLLAFWWLRAPLNEALLLQPAREMSASVDSVRIVLWKQAVSAITQSPWWGYGWNQTPVAQKFGVAAAPGEWSTDYAHNIALDILAWFGVPLGLVLLGLIAWWVGRTAWRLKSGAELLLFCMAVPVLVHSLLEFPFAYAFFLFPLACIFGALHALQAPSSFRVVTAAAAGERLIVGSLLLAYALVAGRVFVEYLAAEEDMRIMRFELRRIGQRPADYAAPNLVLLNQLDEMLKLGRIKPTRDMAPEDLARMGRATQFFSWGTLHLNYVIALGLNGHPEEARRQLEILRDLYGPISYGQAKAEFAAQREHLYPELAAVNVP